MNNLSLINKITKLIPSETIKKAVKETKHCFSDIELVQIIIEFAPSWEQMISLLGEMKKYTNDLKVRKYVSQYINIEKKQYKLLVTQEEGYIYEVVMNEKTNERYLVPDFNSAFITIESFLKHYKKYIEKNDVGKDCSNHNVHVGNFSYFGRTSSLCSLSGYSRFRCRFSPLPQTERLLSFASKLTAWPAPFGRRLAQR